MDRGTKRKRSGSSDDAHRSSEQLEESNALSRRLRGGLILAWLSNRKHGPTKHFGKFGGSTSIADHPPWMPHGGQGQQGDVNRDTKLALKLSKADQDKWLQSYPSWKNKLTRGWKGRKVLGAGTFGIAGLWKHSDFEYVDGQQISQLVVKQTSSKPSSIDQLENEAKWLTVLRSTGSSHIVRMYKELYKEMGSGTHAFRDSASSFVGRIFLEYCDGGDFDQYIRVMYNKYTAKNPMPEELLWHIFRCLALGLGVMENGNELLDDSSWEHELVHFDIKPPNVLIADQDAEHSKIPIFKLADFGMMEDASEINNKGSIFRYAGKGTPRYFGPEQYDMSRYPEQNLRLDTALNIWQIGKTMSILVLRGRIFEKTPIFHASVGPANAVIETYGKRLLDASYSVLLRRTILRCVAYDLKARPSPRELAQIIERALSYFPEKYIMAPEDGGGMYYPEPHMGGFSPSPEDDNATPHPQRIFTLG